VLVVEIQLDKCQLLLVILDQLVLIFFLTNKIFQQILLIGADFGMIWYDIEVYAWSGDKTAN